MSDDTLQAQAEIAVIDTADQEYQALLANLDEKFPPVSAQGFDFSKIRGNCTGRTAKAIVLHLALTGWSVAQIAEAIDAPARSVSIYLADAICEASPIEDVEILRKFEARKLDEQAKACWEQFDRSCQDAVETHEALDKFGEIRELRTVKPQSGNPSYQRVLTDISKHRAKLFGLEKPVQIQIDKREQKLVVSEVIVSTREEAIAAKNAGLLK